METVADLFANVWQFGYVTTDLDRAIEVMSALASVSITA